MTPEQQKKFYADNKADAAKKEKDKDYELFGSRGDAARKGMEEGKTNPMGDTYKKGGKVMKKKCYEDGGEIEFETKMGPNKNIDDETRRKAMEMINLDIDAEPRITKDAPGMSKSAPSLQTRKAFVSKANKAGFAADQTGGGAALMTRKDRGMKKMASGGSVGSASKRADGCAMKGKTRGKIC
jgi:hypothetical protein